MLFCSTNELRQSAVDSLEESRSPATTIKVPNFFQFKSEQISILLVFLVHITNNLWCTSYRHNYLVMCTIYALFTHVHPCNQRGHYQPQQWLEWLLSHVLHLYFYLHVTAKNNVMFLLSVECRFQRYQGWPGSTKVMVLAHELTYIYSLTTHKYQPEVFIINNWLTWPSGLRIGLITARSGFESQLWHIEWKELGKIYYFNWECYQLHGFTPFIEFILWRSRLGSVWSSSPLITLTVTSSYWSWYSHSTIDIYKT